MDQPQTQTQEPNKKLTFEDDVIKKIAGITADEVEGIVSLDGNVFTELTEKITSGEDKTKGIEVDVGEQQVAINMDATIEYGRSAQKVFDQVFTRVKSSIKEMTGLTLVDFELHINDIKTKKELADKQKEQQNS
ncbi:Asp23/Gls24 family envelope stress response protein [Paucilactobacillus kaifaensis]|uniref:Asp23/Gls24 family envelope stress response protein n=1 Tax=Paucilactobacillus kaifaensis TaxID=2559921 RepID=UPI0010F87CF3|nr:Asp23/Gls24 family envelope stress response protein [Paucilactobacillus kaifaensis]